MDSQLPPRHALTDRISQALERASDAQTARKVGRQVQTLRGVRGTPTGDVARVAARAWADHPPRLPRDADALSRLFATAWEDGLVAIGLLAAVLPDAPEEALRLGLQWAERVDDLGTADALGWLVLGPATLMAGDPSVLGPLHGHGRPEVRRAAVMAGMAWLPVALEGPAAAPIRSRLGTKDAQWVDAPQSPWLAELASARARDEAPSVRKALRRLLRAWTASDPAAVAAWGGAWIDRGGLPRMLGDEVLRARRREGK